MKLYTCSKCQNLLYFENNICLNCGSSVGFDAGTLSMITLAPSNAQTFTDINNKKKIYQYCENAVHATCNWLIPATSDASGFCLACSLNRTIPELTNDGNLQRWRRIEVAKHRLVYSLLRLRLPVEAKEGEEEKGIAFDFMADTDPKQRVLTGHDHGVITLNIEEADEAQRVRHKLDLGEKYRTLLGHFRHEIGHYYWDVFFSDEKNAENVRKIFGDDRLDYSQALETYYQNGAPADWNNFFISPYATAHAWEDWAETWAHYLHMMDTLETAYNFGIAVNPRKASDELEMQAKISRDPYNISNFDEIIKMWLPLTFAVNSLNRSMGHQDFYPFIISSAITEKLRFIHETVHSS